MIFRRVAIRGYRSIVRADLKLGEITVVIGPSDSGKSNLVRALRDWAFNASGNAMVTVGCSVARVAVAVGPRHKVVWERRTPDHKEGGTEGNSYYVQDVESDQPILKHDKIGNSVPEEVKEVTRVRPVKVDNLSVRIQFAEQADPWFLLANPPWNPPAVTKVVGKVAGLDALILAAKDLETERRANVGAANATAAKLIEVRARLGEFEGLDAASDLAESAAELLGRIEEKRRKVEEARAILLRLKARRDASARAAAVAAALRPVLARAAELDFVSRAGILDQAREVSSRLAARRVVVDRVFRTLAVLRPLVVRAKEIEATGKGVLLLQAREVLARVKRAEEDGHRAYDRVRVVKTTQVDDALHALEKVADSKELVCPLCNGPAHPACREELRRQAAGV